MNWICFEVQYCIDCHTQVIHSLGIDYCDCGDEVDEESISLSCL